MKRRASAGRTIAKGEADFDAALLGTSFNAQDPGRRPALIVQAIADADVVDAVRQARDQGLTIGICSGGHSWAQNHIRDGGMLIDLSRLDSIVIDPAQRTATIGPGCLAGDLNAALVKHKLFFPVAHAYTVGMGGFLLQGGFGWNSRASGLACQSVIVFTASPIDRPCAVRTSTCRSLATISSGLWCFLAIVPSIQMVLGPT